MSTTVTSAEEEAVFDRQTRLWGADAQKRIRTSKVFIRGRFKGLFSEICKNLVLAGVNISLLLVDEDTDGSHKDLVEEEDLLNNIFLRIEDIGKPKSFIILERIQEMNPFAEVTLTTAHDVEWNQYKLVVSCDESFHTIEDIGRQCRAHKVPLIAVKSAGTLSFTLLDLGQEYTFQMEGTKQQQLKTISSYVSMEEILTFSKWDSLPKGRQSFPFGIFSLWICRELEFQQHENMKQAQMKKQKSVSDKEMIIELIGSKCGTMKMEDVVKNVDDVISAVDIIKRGASLAPVCTITGGLVGQEILKVVSGQGEPISNIMFFDALDASASVRKVPV
jgi:ubiquitin-like 1-activating enzyme E1 A